MNEKKPGPNGTPEVPGGNGLSNIMNFLIVCFVLTFAMNTFMNTGKSENRIQIKYSQFIKLVESGTVERAQLEDEEIVVTLKKDADKAVTEKILSDEETKEESTQEKLPLMPVTQPEPITSEEKVYFTGRIEDPELIERFTKYDVNFYKNVIKSNPLLDFVSTWVFPILIMYMIYMIFMRSMLKRMGSEGGGIGGMMNVGKSKAKVYSVEKKTGVTFADVAGQDEAKESLYEMVDFLNSPERYQEIGAKQPKGVLLVGPPGTGKTLLAKAVAGEAGVPFFSLSGSEFVEMFVGVGASRVRDLFAQATKQAPCIVFIDEIDAIGKSRDNQMGGNDEREQTLNQLLSEMDGFDSSRGIIILAATNRPEILDKALLRPGRFDRRVIVEKPDLIGREAILKVHAEKVKLSDNINLKEIALATSGATGADLANMINEAALLAVKMGRDKVTQADIMEAVEVVVAGKEKKDRILNPKEKKMVAYHEVGHALASALQKDSQPVQKITIVPRTMGALGYTMQMPEEERYLMTKSEMLAQITVLLSGRAAEELILGEISTGASNDIERATQLARSMVTQYGMSEKFDMFGLESIQNKYLDGRTVMNCSEATGALIDEEVGAIIRECHRKGAELLAENKESLIRIAEFLVNKETITGEQFMEILKAEPESESENN